MVAQELPTRLRLSASHHWHRFGPFITSYPCFPLGVSTHGCSTSTTRMSRVASEPGGSGQASQSAAISWSLTNVVRIISGEWLAWLRIGNTAVKTMTTTDIGKPRKLGRAVENSARHVTGNVIERRNE